MNMVRQLKHIYDQEELGGHIMFKEDILKEKLSEFDLSSTTTSDLFNRAEEDGWIELLLELSLYEFSRLATSPAEVHERIEILKGHESTPVKTAAKERPRKNIASSALSRLRKARLADKPRMAKKKPRGIGLTRDEQDIKPTRRFVRRRLQKPALDLLPKILKSATQLLEEDILAFVRINPWCHVPDILKHVELPADTVHSQFMELLNNGYLKTVGEGDQTRCALG